MTEKPELTAIIQATLDNFVDRCTACGECVQTCPVDKTPLMPDGPESAVEGLLAVLDEGKTSQEAYDLTLSCTHCRQCSDVCPEGLIPDMLMVLALAECIRLGMPMPETFDYLDSSPGGMISLLETVQQSGDQQRWITEIPDSPPKKEVVLYLGCLGRTVPHQINSAIDLFETLDLDYIAIAGGQICCGIPQLAAGEYSAAQDKGGELVKALAAFKPKTVIHACTACYNTVTRMLSETIDIPFSSQHILHFLNENVDKLPFPGDYSKTVTYHDSCELGRGHKEYDSVRQLIQAVPGVKFVEMEHNRDKTLCCGFQGTLFTNPQEANPNRRRRLQEAKDVNADILVTPCRGCFQSFSSGELQYDLEVMDYTVLLARALGFHHENKLPQIVEIRPESFLPYLSKNEKIEDPKRAEAILVKYLDTLKLRD